MAGERFTFGSFALDVSERRLTHSNAGHEGRIITLPPKAYDVLVCLVRNAGRLVTKRELLHSVWPETFVEEGILTVHVSTLRKALADATDGPSLIETVPKSGYRFVGSVVNAAGAAGSTADVHELVGRARMLLASSSRAGIPKAVETFDAAIALDPSYAAAHAGLALAHCAEAQLRLRPAGEAYERARSGLAGSGQRR